jgi:chemotaxis protein MotB
MAAFGRRARRRSLDIWPGFVDALSTLLMVIIFVLLVFMVAQFYMGQALSGRNEALDRLTRQVNELGDLLALERRSNADLRSSVAQLSSDLQASLSERERLSSQAARADELAGQLSQLTASAQSAGGQVDKLSKELEDAYKTISADREKIQLQLRDLALLRQDVAALKALRTELESRVAELNGRLGDSQKQTTDQQKMSDAARAQAALLNQQLQALRDELTKLANALESSEKLSSEQKAQIANLGQRLNQALASKVEELQRYRSEFFGKLRQVLGGRPGIRVEGDRFVFQSELLFPSGSADLAPEGQIQLAQLATTLRRLMQEIPPDVNWVLRVDGHTDKIPIYNIRYPSNWELSTARATSVVKFLMMQGIPPERLAAAGFGEFNPIDQRDAPDALAKNRRIEIRMDQR